MKLIFTLILFFSYTGLLHAQEKRELYNWESSKAKISAVAEIHTADKPGKTGKVLIFFLPDDLLKDSVSNDLDSFIAMRPKTCTVIKVLFSKPADTFSLSIFHLFANDIVNDFLSQLKKDNPKLAPGNIIYAGLNEGAFTALFCAAKDPKKTASTGMFTERSDLYISLKNETDTLPVQLAGKLFVYHRRQNEQDVAAGNFCDAVAMNDDLLLYKTEADKKPAANIFIEFFNWITAEGSNYIIRPD